MNLEKVYMILPLEINDVNFTMNNVKLTAIKITVKSRHIALPNDKR